MRVWPKPPQPAPEEEEPYTGAMMEKYQEKWHEPADYIRGQEPQTRSGMLGREYNPQRHAKKSWDE
jgi:hypothetical protein